LFTDIESFLTDTLKSTSLSKSITGEKDELLKKLKTLRSEFPQLNVEAREKAPDSVTPSGYITCYSFQMEDNVNT